MELAKFKEANLDLENKLDETISLIIQKEEQFEEEKKKYGSIVMSVKEKLAKATEENESMLMKLNDKDQRFVALQTEHQETLQGVQSLTQSLELAEQHVSQFEQDIKALLEKFEAQKSENEVLQLELAEAHETLSTAERDYKTKITQFQQRLKEQTSQTESYLANFEEMTKELEESKQTISVLENSLEEQQRVYRLELQDVKVLKSRIADLESNQETLLLRIQTMESEAKLRETDLVDVEKKLQKDQASLLALNGKLKLLEKDLDQEKEKTGSLNQEMEKKDAKIQILKQSLEKSSQNFDALQEGYSELNDKLKALENKKQDLEFEIWQQESSLREKDAEFKTVKSELAKTLAKNEQLSTEIEEKSALIRKLEGDVAEKQTELSTVTELKAKLVEVESLKSQTDLEFEDLSDKYYSLVCKTRKLEKQVGEFKIKLGAKKGELETPTEKENLSSAKPPVPSSVKRKSPERDTEGRKKPKPSDTPEKLNQLISSTTKSLIKNESVSSTASPTKKPFAVNVPKSQLKSETDLKNLPHKPELKNPFPPLPKADLKSEPEEKEIKTTPTSNPNNITTTNTTSVPSKQVPRRSMRRSLSNTKPLGTLVEEPEENCKVQ